MTWGWVGRLQFSNGNLARNNLAHIVYKRIEEFTHALPRFAGQLSEARIEYALVNSAARSLHVGFHAIAILHTVPLKSRFCP